MKKANEIKVNELKATPQELRVAMERVAKNSKTWVKWNDPRAYAKEDKAS